MDAYAVVWSESDGSLCAGKLTLDDVAVRLDGCAARTVRYAEIESHHVGRDSADRLHGRPSLVLELVTGGLLRIGSLAGPGTLSELAERLVSHLPAPAA